MRAFFRCMFWRLAYLFQRRPTDFGDYLTRMSRTGWPWRQFRPNVRHNHDGREWEIWLANERSYVESGVMLKVDVQVSETTGRIVGFCVHDETLAMMRRCLLAETEDVT